MKNWIAVCGALLMGLGHGRAIAAPDLFIESSKSRPPTMTYLKSLTLKVSTRNQGDAPSPATDIRLRIDENNDGSWDHTFTVPLEAIPASDVIKTKWKAVWEGSVGTHKYEVCADPGDTSGDADITNNCIYSWLVVVPSIPEFSDLIVRYFRPLRSRPTDGELLTLLADVRNHGAAAVDYSQGSLQIDGGTVEPFDFYSMRGPGNRRFKFEDWLVATAGVHSYRVCVGAITQYESDFTNNCIEGTFIVGQ